MIYKLPKERYSSIIPLFKDKSYLNIFRSHLGYTTIKKTVYVDSLDNPQTAVIVVVPRLFFGGKADNKNFNKSFQKILYNQLIHEFFKQNQQEVVCYLANDEWLESIKNILNDPYFYEYYYYEIKKLKIENWRDLIPPKYTLEPINITLLEKQYLKNYEWLLEELKENWLPFEEGLKEIRGFYLVWKDEEIVSWCTLEYLTNENDIEVGIATNPDYQNKGLATLVGSATADFALKKYNSVGWNCSANNTGSWKTAEKIGYERQVAYMKAGCFFNRVDNCIVNGFVQARKKNYIEAIKWYKKVINLAHKKDPDFETTVVLNEEFPFSRLIFRLSTYYAAIEDVTNSFKYLKMAIENGFNDKNLLENDELIKILHKKAEWREIIAKMK